MKKRLFIFALAAVISMSAASLVGCGKNEVNNAAVSASATPSEATKTEESTVNTTAPAQTQTTTSVAADTKTENKSADNKSATKGSDATAPANNTSKTENNSKTSGSSQTQSSNKSTQSGSQTNSQTNNQSSKSTNKNTSNNTNTNTNNGSSSKSSSADPHAGKTWHEAVYKTVNHPAVTGERKVIDQPADSYEEPVYETKLIAKCKDCGIDLSQLSQSERTAHSKNHVLNEGGDGGWYTATEQVQVGTRTVEVPEQSHMETYIVKEAWTEKVLVKEAGWY